MVEVVEAEKTTELVSIGTFQQGSEKRWVRIRRYRHINIKSTLSDSVNIRPAHSFIRSFIYRSISRSIGQSVEQVDGQTFFYIRMNTLHFHMDAL